RVQLPVLEVCCFENFAGLRLRFEPLAPCDVPDGTHGSAGGTGEARVDGVAGDVVPGRRVLRAHTCCQAAQRGQRGDRSNRQSHYAVVMLRYVFSATRPEISIASARGYAVPGPTHRLCPDSTLLAAGNFWNLLICRS